MEFRKDIQVLRGFSVLFVVFYHLEIPGFSSGLLGVDIFFVISGYLMAMLVDKGSVVDFYKRRLRRLAPAYFVTVGVTAVVCALITVPVDFNQVLDQSIYSLFFSNNIGFWQQSSYFQKSDFNPLLNLWSLGVEVQFYIIAPFLLALLRPRPILLGLVILASIVSCVLVVGISPKTAFFHLPFRVWEFLIGASVAWYFSNLTVKNKPNNAINYVFLATLCLILIIPVTPVNSIAVLSHPGLSAMATCVVTALIIANRLPAKFTDSHAGRSLVVLGKYSYSIYLVHFPVIVLFNYSAFNGTILGYSNYSELGLLLFTILVLSIVLHHGVEVRKWLVFRSPKPYALLILLGLGVSTSSVLNAGRFNDQQNLVFSAWTDRSSFRCGKLFRVLNPSKRFCKISPEISQAKGNVLLVGSSHADAIKTKFASVYSSAGYNVYFYVNNRPLLSNSVTVSSVVKDAVELGVSSVVLHYHDTAFDDKLINNISELSEQLDKLAVQLALLSPVPTYEYHVPKYLYSVSANASTIGAKSLEQQRQENQLFWNHADSAKWENITILETANFLCPERTCLRISESGRPLYYDGSHLTLTGSDYLKQLFKQLVAKLDTSIVVSEVNLKQ